MKTTISLGVTIINKQLITCEVVFKKVLPTVRHYDHWLSRNSNSPGTFWTFLVNKYFSSIFFRICALDASSTIMSINYVFFCKKEEHSFWAQNTRRKVLEVNWILAKKNFLLMIFKAVCASRILKGHVSFRWRRFTAGSRVSGAVSVTGREISSAPFRDKWIPTFELGRCFGG